MTLRRRLLLALVATAGPLTAGLAWLQEELHRRALEGALREMAELRLQALGKERCEADPAALSLRPFRPEGPPPGAPFPPGPPPGGPGGPPRGGLGRGPGPPPRVDLFLYDAAFAVQTPGGPPLPRRVQERLAAGATVASERDPLGLQFAFATGWGGRCAFLLARRPDQPPPPVVAGGLPVLLALASAAFALAVWLAAGPVVRRIHVLAGEVRQAAASRYATEVQADGADEVADLGRAFNEAGRELRAHVVRLEEREQTLRTFLADTTHDVMLPLTVLQGHLASMRKRLAEGAAVEESLVSAARDEADYMASLVHNLGAAAKLEAGEPLLRTDPVALGTLVERVVERHRPVAAARNIELAWGVPPEEVKVKGDLTLLEQAVSNLVHNAVRHNRPQGHVAVVLEAVREPPSFLLAVSDDGPGVADEELPRLGERRFRSAEARQRHPDGRGLGLAIARAVAERHGFTLAFSRSEHGGLRAELRGRLDA